MALLLADSAQSHPRPLNELLKLNSKTYTGGLDRPTRDIAEHIHAAMSAGYTETCAAPDPMAGELVGLADGTDKKPLSPLEGVDPDLAALIGALDAPQQEVRDAAAYTIALLGPSAKAARPALEKHFAAAEPGGGWYNFALERVSCQLVTAPDFRKALPASMLPPEALRAAFRNQSMLLLARLYLDDHYEYPPGMMATAYLNYGFDDVPAEAIALLAQILDNDRLSDHKHIEAAAALTRIRGENVALARAALERNANARDAELRFYVGNALARLHSEKAIPLISEQFKDGSFDPKGIANELCAFGHAARTAEDHLIDLAVHAAWSSVAREALHALGCVGSKKALPLLTAKLTTPDWEANVAAATAIGQIGGASPDVIAILERLSEHHWSSKVRKAANDALAILRGTSVPSPAKPQKGKIETIVVGGPPGPVDHGLPWCDDHGRYSIDGKSWFFVKWIEPKLEPLPNGFPAQGVPLQHMGTQSFLQIDDGWLFGSDGFEDEGFLAHVSRGGTFQELDEQNASILGIANVNGHHMAFGFEILKSSDRAGSLLELYRATNDSWRANRVLALPSAPTAHAIAPGGELLLTDGPNDYAVIGNDVVPLKCEKTFPGRYFDKN